MPVTKCHAALRDRVISYFSPDSPKHLAVAVSGGSDSLALLALLNDWSRAGGPQLHVVTVDHGLRPESADEAAQVARICARMGVAHAVLRWTGWDGQGNLPDRARRARYRLMAGWAGAAGIGHVALGHTANDQAETFLMRLAREAGVDGLAAMSASWRIGEVTFCRPVLRLAREDLRDVLRAKGLKWSDDPSNDDPAYERVRARQVMAALAPLGITAGGLSSVAHHMAEVRRTLYFYVSQAARDSVSFQAGDLLIDREGFEDLPNEIARRLLQSALKWVSGAGYGPRGRAMELLLDAVRCRSDMTLSGCLIMMGKDQLRVIREYKAVAELHGPVGGVWDGRWRVTGPETEGAMVAALGPEGLKQCPDRRASGLPDASMMAAPAVWRGDELLAAPLAGLKNGWYATEIDDGDGFFASFLSQ